jgi:anaerobic selenocysteine-containing dehydrogenase
MEGALVPPDQYPIHAITQRPAAMYHSWGSHNAWLRQIHGYNRLCMHRDLALELGVEDDDWVSVESHHGKITAQVRAMTGCERNTVWTWNAIGNRRGAWNLADDAAEGEKAFLLNHLISELLPADGKGGKKIGRMSNSDPVTGQAAWFDLRVRISKLEVMSGSGAESGADAGSQVCEPQFEPLKPMPGAPARPQILRFGEQFLPRNSWRRKEQK